MNPAAVHASDHAKGRCSLCTVKDVCSGTSSKCGIMHQHIMSRWLLPICNACYQQFGGSYQDMIRIFFLVDTTLRRPLLEVGIKTVDIVCISIIAYRYTACDYGDLGRICALRVPGKLFASRWVFFGMHG